MTQVVLQKAIALILLIAVGYVLKGKFSDAAAVGALRNFILNVALPATIFLSTIEIDTRIDLLILPMFALGINVYLMAVGWLLASWLIPKSESTKLRALILLFPSLAPGLTVYPFIEQFLGRQGLAWAALADMGNKIFVLVGLYLLAMFWFQMAAESQKSRSTKLQWHSILRFLLTEPVNLAIVAGFALAAFNLRATSLPLALLDSIQKFALCATPLILFYVGITLKLKFFQLGKILIVLLVRSGTAFLFSAGAIALLNPPDAETLMLFVALPQASCSLWPLLHATAINTQQTKLTGAPSTFFDTEFATALLAMSFPFSIFVLLVVFSSGDFFKLPLHLGYAGAGLLGMFGLLIAVSRLPVQVQSPIDVQIHFRSPVRPRESVPLLPNEPKAPASSLPDVTEEALTNGKGAETYQTEQLEKLHRLLHRYLSTELGNDKISLQLQFFFKDRELIILGQHTNGTILNLDHTFEYLERSVKTLDLDFADRLRLYFRTIGDRKPYAGYTIRLRGEDDATYAVKS
jgi:hypothetical protein